MQHRNLRRYFRHGTLTHLAVFEAVARHGSFSRAAEELSMAQPTASVQIKKLAETLGVALFQTAGRRVQLTPAGQELLSACHDIFERLGEVDARLAELRAAAHGSLRVAVGISVRSLASRLIGSFSARFPNVEIAVPVLNRGELLSRLAARADDFYILSSPPEDAELVSHALLPSFLEVYARADHPLARRGRLRFQEIAKEPFLMREPGSGTRTLVDGLFARFGATPWVRMEMGSNEAIEQAVRDGLGISILSEQTVGAVAPVPGLCVLDVEGFPVERCWHLVHQNEELLPPSARMFLEHLQEVDLLKELRACARARHLAGVQATPAVYSDAPTDHN